MSCADEEGCFTFTWEFENFDIFLRVEEGRLLSPMWKAETTEGKTIEWQVLAYQCRSFTRVHLICSNKTWKPDRCESFVMTATGKMSPTSPHAFSVLQFADFEICNEDLIGVNGRPRRTNIPRNCLNLECKIWSNSMKSGEFRIHTVLKKVNFCWCLEDPYFYKPSCNPYSHNKIIEEDGVRIIMILESEGENDKYRIRALALPMVHGCFSFIYCNVVGDFETITQENAIVEYNYFRNEYREECRNGKQSGVSCNTSYKINLQLDTIVSHHNNCRYQIACPTSSPITKTEVRSETVNDPLTDLLRLYKEGSILSDVTINTEGKSFSAHKSILGVRSPVFRAMFEKDEMSEGRSGVVDIDNVESKTVDRMLVFLYGDSLQGLQWAEAAPLYYAADKYDVHPLKQKCADILKSGLTDDNVCDALVLADKHSDEHFMKWAVDFIYEHKEVVSSPAWQQLEESKPRLTSKVTKELFLKRGNILGTLWFK